MQYIEFSEWTREGSLKLQTDAGVDADGDSGRYPQSVYVCIQ